MSKLLLLHIIWKKKKVPKSSCSRIAEKKFQLFFSHTKINSTQSLTKLCPVTTCNCSLLKMMQFWEAHHLINKTLFVCLESK